MKRITTTLYALLLSATLFAQSQYPPRSSGEIVSHSHFTLSYVESAEQAEWVYYELTPQMISGTISRTDNFREDKKVSTISAQLEDYRGSGYDRGHLCPAGSMKLSRESMSESFLLSNMSPQVPSFNRGIWSRLEKLVRSWVACDSLLCVVSGPILSDDMERIGPNEVAVPKHFYKAIYAPKQGKMIAFLLPNEKSSEALESFLVTVDLIEQLTAIDLFHALPDSLENRLEQSIDHGSWSIK